ncbi:hypothetical protein KH990_03555 [Methanoculleus bourgensis]|uniref:hypothetical protein n=1 Tax=Methanoculleus bourgensis TaxID=83986 RepID=UPI00184E5799|nr:hypothetical protein [Methanoculleus bourgensis]MBT0732448.1 hypothetical protein [Methanoculleus bourgensis]MDD3372874.1 hypothetical protein [Methanoculleus bourgensis]NMA89636.1 hypothetical protein [Methanoculleus bourgensis]
MVRKNRSVSTEGVKNRSTRSREASRRESSERGHRQERGAKNAKEIAGKIPGLYDFT